MNTSNIQYCSWVKLGLNVSVLADLGPSVGAISSSWDCGAIWLASTDVYAFGGTTYHARFGELYTRNSSCAVSNASVYTPAINYGVIDDTAPGNMLKDVPIIDTQAINLLYEYSLGSDSQFANFTPFNSSMAYDAPCPICNAPFGLGKYLMMRYRNCSAPQAVLFDSSFSTYTANQCSISQATPPKSSAHPAQQHPSIIYYYLYYL